MKIVFLTFFLPALMVNVATAAELGAGATAMEPAAHEHVHGDAGAAAKGEPVENSDAKGMDCGRMHKKHHSKKGCAGMMDESAKKKSMK